MEGISGCLVRLGARLLCRAALAPRHHAKGGAMDWSIVSSTGSLAAAWFSISWPGLLVGAVAAAALVAGWWLWWRLPKRQGDHLSLTIRDAKERADVEDNFRK